MAHVEILVEEPSMETALRLLVPKIASVLSFEVHPYQCKADLLEKLPNRLQGYARWLPDNWRIVVLVDRDDDRCTDLKAKMEDAARRASMPTRTTQKGSWQVVNRLVIEELEAWFFGDWQAVRAAYPSVDANIPAKAKFRNPDAVPGGTWEALERILMKAGYFKTGLRKIEAAKAIAQHMEPERNTSRSFRVFRKALLEMTDP